MKLFSIKFLFLCFLSSLSVSAVAQISHEDLEAMLAGYLETNEVHTKTDTFPPAFRYRVKLKDKAGSPFSLSRPSEFLSEKALARRAKYGIKVDAYDLPVSPTYLQRLRDLGVKVVNVSKWNNTAVVESSDSMVFQTLEQLPFVTKVTFVWSQPTIVQIPIVSEEDRTPTNRLDPYKDYYGAGQHQAEMLAIPALHRLGYEGTGVTIAMIDGGYRNADRITGYDRNAVLSTRNFVRPDSSVYVEGDHGLNALSCIAANQPYALIGTAPKAQFHLLVSEDGWSEQLVEEDNWATAIEYADSVGADIVSSSLGYASFDHKSQNHGYDELDGVASVASWAASLAASRGLLVCVSAGNEGDNHWKKITSPADAKDILTVGALQSDSINTLFSSLGNTSDGRIKPDVAAMGEQVALLSDKGTIKNASGTSFSCPSLAGAVACLVEAFPKKTPLQIMEAVRRSGHYATRPNNVYGYGLPNMMKAYELLKVAK